MKLLITVFQVRLLHSNISYMHLYLQNRLKCNFLAKPNLIIVIFCKTFAVLGTY